jgi:hypothetical protein
MKGGLNYQLPYFLEAAIHQRIRAIFQHDGIYDALIVRHTEFKNPGLTETLRRHYRVLALHPIVGIVAIAVIIEQHAVGLRPGKRFVPVFDAAAYELFGVHSLSLTGIMCSVGTLFMVRRSFPGIKICAGISRC